MKTCAWCGLEKDESEFNWRWHEKGVKQPICRDCQRLSRREHYERHTQQEKNRTKEISHIAKEEAERFIYEYLSTSICVDCGEYDFSVLTFDHVRGIKKMED